MRSVCQLEHPVRPEQAGLQAVTRLTSQQFLARGGPAAARRVRVPHAPVKGVVSRQQTRDELRLLALVREPALLAQLHSSLSPGTFLAESCASFRGCGGSHLATRPSTSLALTGRSWSASTRPSSVLVSLISARLSAPFSCGASKRVGQRSEKSRSSIP